MEHREVGVGSFFPADEDPAETVQPGVGAFDDPAAGAEAGLAFDRLCFFAAAADMGQYLQSGWKDYGSVSAIDVSTGKLVWKFDTPQPERGGVTTTASGVGFVGGGDGNLRAFDAKTGKVLWTFQTGYQIAAGPTVYSVDGTEYVAITVGGTTTSSSGGTVASQLQVFNLGGSQTQSHGPDLHDAPTCERLDRLGAPRRRRPPIPCGLQAVLARQPSPSMARRSRRSCLRLPCSIQPWNPNTSNTEDVQGRVLVGGKPVAGVAVRIDGWVAPLTDSSGLFTYPVDNTMPGRHVVTIASVSGARVDGRKLTATQQSALMSAKKRHQRRLLGAGRDDQVRARGHDRRLRPHSPSARTSPRIRSSCTATS